MPLPDRHDIAAALGPRRATLASWALLASALIVALGSAGWSARTVQRAWRAMQAAGAMPAPAVAAVATAPARTPEPAADFVQDLPATASTDAQIRFAAKIARESQVELQRMQSEPMRTDPSHLGQVRMTLQLRGDYRDEKAVLGAMLGRFPGLTLEHFTVRHHGDGVVADGARSDDEATIDLVQYLRPAGS